MTLKGTIDKSFLLLIVLMAAALWPWSQMADGDVQAVSSTMLSGPWAASCWPSSSASKRTWRRTSPLPYAALEGLVVGGISAILEQRYHGIAIQAVGLTFGVLAALLIAYRQR